MSASMLIFPASFLLIHSLVNGLSTEPSETNFSTNAFIPTNEWQVVQPGQPIPPGLHSRLNLQTGVVEAKLLDENSAPENNYPAALVSDDDSELSSKSLEFADNQAKTDVPRGGKLKAHPISINADTKLINELMAQLESTEDEKQILTLLDDLAHLLHEINNGIYFAANHGFIPLYKFLFHTASDVKHATLRTITAVVQGNAKAKIAAFRDNILNAICQIIEDVFKLSADTTTPHHPKQSFINSALTCLSALLRNFPSAQTYFFTSESAHPGLNGFELLDRMYEFPPARTLLWKIRIFTFITDLATERSNAFEQFRSDPSEAHKNLTELYARIPFEDLLQQNGWCTRLYRIVLDDLERAVLPGDQVTSPNHNFREKILESLFQLSSICKTNFLGDSDSVDILTDLKSEYYLRCFAREDESDTYFDELHDLLTKILDSISSSTEHHRDEL